MLEAILAWLGHPTTWIAILVIGMCGDTAKALVLGPKSARPKDGFKGWRGVYAVTYRVHALIVGLLVGLVSAYLLRLPGPEAFDSEGGQVAYWIGNGGLAMILYAAVVGTLKAIFANYAKRGAK